MQNKPKYIFILVTVSIMLAILLIYFLIPNSNLKDENILIINPPQQNQEDADELSNEDPVACTMDAMMCPDGSYVGRSAPGCEFRCPAQQNQEDPIACTMDAMMCPDGSYVGRSLPGCEFRCPSSNNSGILPFDSGVEGVVTIGPTCPVVKEGDLSCADKPYSTTIEVINIGSIKSSIFSSVESDKEGNYKLMLPPGEYTLQSNIGNTMPSCESKNIIIEPSKIIKVNISCDSGIR